MDDSEIERIANDSLAAAMTGRNPAEIIRPLFEEGGPRECFLWTMAMVTVSMKHVPKAHERPEGIVACPEIAKRMPDGSVEVQESPDAAPLGISTYVRLAAAYLNDDVDTATALWDVLSDTVDLDDGREFTRCMVVALMAAVQTLRADQAKLQ